MDRAPNHNFHTESGDYRFQMSMAPIAEGGIGQVLQAAFNHETSVPDEWTTLLDRLDRA